MKITATALDSFAHGARMYVAGDPVEATPGDMADMVKAGLVSLPDTAPAEAPAEENLDDLVGGEKMAEEVQNKMAPAPTNKKAR